MVQLHHKITTFEHLSKHLVLVVQDRLLTYMKSQFAFDHLQTARVGDPMHFHSYSLEKASETLKLQLMDRLSTDARGISKCLGLQSDAKVELEEIVRQIEAKLTARTLMSMAQPPPAATLLQLAAEDDS